MKITILIKYRFSDDQDDVIREYESEPYYDAQTNSICLIPRDAFDGKRIVLLQNPLVPNEILRELYIESVKQQDEK